MSLRVLPCTFIFFFHWWKRFFFFLYLYKNMILTCMLKKYMYHMWLVFDYICPHIVWVFPFFCALCIVCGNLNYYSLWWWLEGWFYFSFLVFHLLIYFLCPNDPRLWEWIKRTFVAHLHSHIPNWLLLITNLKSSTKKEEIRLECFYLLFCCMSIGRFFVALLLTLHIQLECTLKLLFFLKSKVTEKWT